MLARQGAAQTLTSLKLTGNYRVITMRRRACVIIPLVGGVQRPELRYETESATTLLIGDDHPYDDHHSAHMAR
jgi:hypothetical protein